MWVACHRACDHPAEQAVEQPLPMRLQPLSVRGDGGGGNAARHPEELQDNGQRRGGLKTLLQHATVHQPIINRVQGVVAMCPQTHLLPPRPIPAMPGADHHHERDWAGSGPEQLLLPQQCRTQTSKSGHQVHPFTPVRVPSRL